MNCFFCQNMGGEVVFNCDLYRVILVDDGDYPGYLRVVLNYHIKELTDLDMNDNLSVYKAVVKCEEVLRSVLNPDKINIASFGNMTPHVHWHIIPRFLGDLHFTNPTWGEVTNPDYLPAPEVLQSHQQLLKQFSTLFLA